MYGGYALRQKYPQTNSAGRIPLNNITLGDYFLNITSTYPKGDNYPPPKPKDYTTTIVIPSHFSDTLVTFLCWGGASGKEIYGAAKNMEETSRLGK